MHALLLPLVFLAGVPSVDAKALDELVKQAAALDTDALVVMHNGKVVLEKWFDGKPRPIESMSVTKSIVAMAVGRLITSGKLRSLDEPVSTWFPEWKQGRKRLITVRHLLEQTSGLQADRMTGTEINGAPDYVQLALCAELSADPGSTFFYNNKATNLLPALVQRLDGRRIDVLLDEDVFSPLGIRETTWELDSRGNAQGMSGLRIAPRDLARLGQLMLDEGRFDGTRILDEKWVREAILPTKANPGYGQLWWLVGEPTMVIDDDVIGTWRKGGVGEKFISAIERLKGRPLKGDAFFGAVSDVLKDQGGVETWHNTTWRKGLPDGRVVHKDVVGFRGDGWQGQQLIVLKKERLVVVRMREPSEGNTPEENDKYGFPQLVRLSRALVRP